MHATVRWLLGLVFVTLVGAAVRGQDEPAAVYKFDKEFTQTWTTKVKQTVTVADKEPGKSKEPFTQQQEVVVTVLWKPQPPSTDGKTQQFKVAIKELNIKAEAGERKMTFDSKAAPSQTDPLDPVFRKLLAAEFTVTLETPSLKVSKIEGLEPLLTGVTQQQRPIVESVIDAKSLERFVETTFPTLPARKGEKTERKGSASARIGTLDTKVTWTRKDTKDKQTTFDVEEELELTPKPDGMETVVLKEATPAKVTFTGTLVFDHELGRVRSQTLEVKNWTRTMKVEIDKVPAEAVVVQDYWTEVKTAD